MFEIGRINCYGHCTAPSKWNYRIANGINRLYFIHSGSGGYITGEKFFKFEPGKVYFFPYMAKYSLISDEKSPILHTYTDFELIPPIISDEIFSITPDDPLSEAAVNTFVCGAKLVTKKQLKINSTEHSEAIRMCFSAISYLVCCISRSSENAAALADPIVINALEFMLKNLNTPLSVRNLAAESFLTTDSFIRRFRRCIGVTPYSYFKSLRLRTARYMISDGKSLSLVAEAVGYADSTALLHALKEK